MRIQLKINLVNAQTGLNSMILLNTSGDKIVM